MAHMVGLIAFAFLLTLATGQETECPFKAGPWKSDIDQAQVKLGMSITDLADGNIFEAMNSTELIERCKQTGNDAMSRWLQIISEHINRCQYDDTKPRLGAFYIEGAKKAFTYLCNDSNIKVLEDKGSCLEEAKPDIKACHDAKMANAGSDKDIMFQKCSLHRVHAYCARKILKPKCGDEIGDLKEKVAQLVFPPACDCGLDTKRKKYQDPRAKDCMKDKDCWSHPEEGHLMESQIHTGVLFGARNMNMLKDLCEKGESQDAKPKIVNLLGSCFDRGSLCAYPVQKYKLMLINMDGMKEAANTMCEKFNDFKADETCVVEKTEKTKKCYENAVKQIKEELTQQGKFDDMKEVVCKRHEKFRSCIDDNFGKCASNVYETVKDMAATRIPRMCECKKIGYTPNSANDVTHSSFLFSLFSVVFCLYLSRWW